MCSLDFDKQLSALLLQLFLERVPKPRRSTCVHLPT
jgi:hypothetical protein